MDDVGILYNRKPMSCVRDRRKAFLRVLTVLVGIGGIYSPFLHAARQTAPPRPITPRGEFLPQEKSTIDLFRKSMGSVVYITTLIVRQDFFSFNVFEIPAGTGSGFVWDKKGHVVTNFHVVRKAQKIKVTLSDQSIHEAELVGVAPDKDLAVLKIDPPKKGLQPIPMGTSHDLKVGQSVFAIGNPFGLDHTLTTGIISALGREIQSVTRRPISGVIQTDAAINPGNSGGPLLDSAGRLIGVNTAIFSPSGANAGVGFAVPVDIVNSIVPQLIAFGRVIRPGMGINIAEDPITSQLGIEGVLVISVFRGSAADRAGFQGTRRDQFGQLILGDIIVGFDGRPVTSNNDLYKDLEMHDVGDTLIVDVVRDGKPLKLKVMLQELD